jgi:UDP-galactopyranose mutase
MYDFLVVGAGLFGATFARLATDAGKKCLVIDKRSHIAGNCYTENISGINVHMYGPHIFHCNDDNIWSFVNRFARFNGFKNSPIAISQGKAFSLPFSMYTFNQMWGVTSPHEALTKIDSQRLILDREPANLEEQALTLVGYDIYNTLIRDYTRKQWQKDPKELPADIIKRLPVRLTWDNNYFNDKYQGIPIGGYTRMFQEILKGIEVRLDIDFIKDRNELELMARQIVFTGGIDEYYEYRFGQLEYRTLRFDSMLINSSNHQGNAVVNYSDLSTPWTRVIEHKHFEPENRVDKTYITKEIPDKWEASKIPYYPISDTRNKSIWKKYNDISKCQDKVIFGGRLSEYKYYDMHQVIGSAMSTFKKQEKKTNES